MAPQAPHQQAHGTRQGRLARRHRGLRGDPKRRAADRMNMTKQRTCYAMDLPASHTEASSGRPSSRTLICCFGRSNRREIRRSRSRRGCRATMARD